MTKVYTMNIKNSCVHFFVMIKYNVEEYIRNMERNIDVSVSCWSVVYEEVF